MCDTALEIGCLVLVDDTDLCELVYHSVYLRGTCFCCTFVSSVSLHNIYYATCVFRFGEYACLLMRDLPFFIFLYFLVVGRGIEPLLQE